jgi:hypothetical protein
MTDPDLTNAQRRAAILELYDLMSRTDLPPSSVIDWYAQDVCGVDSETVADARDIQESYVAGNKRATRSEVREHAPEYADGGGVSDVLTGAQEDSETRGESG